MQERAKLGPLIAMLSARRDWVDINATAATGAVTEGEASCTSHRTSLSYATDFGLPSYIAYAISFTPVIGVKARLAATADHCCKALNKPVD